MIKIVKIWCTLSRTMLTNQNISECCKAQYNTLGKAEKIVNFAECHNHNTWQTNSIFLPSARIWDTRQRNSKQIKKNFAECHARGHLAKKIKKNLCWVPSQGYSIKKFRKKRKKPLSSVLPSDTWQRNFEKKRKKSLPSAQPEDTRQSHRHLNRCHDDRFSLPSADAALGKAFATDKWHSAKRSFPLILLPSVFNKCSTRQSLYWVHIELCWVSQALGKASISSSVLLYKHVYIPICAAMDGFSQALLEEPLRPSSICHVLQCWNIYGVLNCNKLFVSVVETYMFPP